MDGVPQIAGFEFYEQIAETSRSVIWRAKQHTLERDVLVQILRPETAAKPELREHFFDVVRALARIKSELFPSVLDIIYEGDRPYMIVEDDHSENLTNLLKGGVLPPDQLMDLAQKFCEGFKILSEEAHLVYRNLKPTIIRVMEGRQPRLVDLSLAVFESPNCRSKTLDGGIIIGTPAYISPEQYTAPDSVDTRSDMYTLGATLYTLATGEVPFGNMTPLLAIRAKQTSHLSSPCDSQPAISKEFAAFIARLMMRKPEDRFQNWEEAQTALQSVFSGDSIDKILPGGYDSNRSTVSAPAPRPSRPVKKIVTRPLASKTTSEKLSLSPEADDGTPHGLIGLVMYALLIVAVILLGVFRWQQLRKDDQIARQEIQKVNQTIERILAGEGDAQP